MKIVQCLVEIHVFSTGSGFLNAPCLPAASCFLENMHLFCSPNTLPWGSLRKQKAGRDVLWPRLRTLSAMCPIEIVWNCGGQCGQCGQHWQCGQPWQQPPGLAQERPTSRQCRQTHPIRAFQICIFCTMHKLGKERQRSSWDSWPCKLKIATISSAKYPFLCKPNACAWEIERSELGKAPSIGAQAKLVQGIDIAGSTGKSEGWPRRVAAHTTFWKMFQKKTGKWCRSVSCNMGAGLG